MKTRNWIFTILAFFIVAIGTATETPKMNVIPVEEEKAMVAFKAGNPTLFELTLENEAGDILYYKRTDKPLDKYQKIFNFSELGDGKYTVCLNYGTSSINRDIEVNNKAITVGCAVQLYEPFFSYDNDKLKISFLNITQKNVYMNIYKDGEHLVRNRLGKDMCIQKCFDLSRLEEGNYRIVVTDYFKDHTFIAHK